MQALVGKLLKSVPELHNELLLDLRGIILDDEEIYGALLAYELSIWRIVSLVPSLLLGFLSAPNERRARTLCVTSNYALVFANRRYYKPDKLLASVPRSKFEPPAIFARSASSTKFVFLGTRYKAKGDWGKYLADLN